MNAHVDHILDEALGLDATDRAALVAALVDSLDGDDEALVTAAWAKEIRLRREQLRSGQTHAVPWLEVKARLAAL